MQSLLGGHLAALLHSSYRSVGGCDRTQHLQASDAQGQALRRAGRTSATAAAHVEVNITPHTRGMQVSRIWAAFPLEEAALNVELAAVSSSHLELLLCRLFLLRFFYFFFVLICMQVQIKSC